MTKDGDARLRWRCRRGMKELDILLERFLKIGFMAMDGRQKVVFSDFLQLPDPQLADYLLKGVVPADEDIKTLVEQILSCPHD